MGLFKKTPMEIRVEEAEEFAKSPTGQAQAARKKGARIFQISLTLSETTANVVPMSGAYTQGREIEAHATTLDSIEAQGWRLEHAGYVFRVIGSQSRDKFMSSGQQEAVSGEIVGIYLFRATSGETSEGGQS